MPCSVTVTATRGVSKRETLPVLRDALARPFSRAGGARPALSRPGGRRWPKRVLLGLVLVTVLAGAGSAQVHARDAQVRRQAQQVRTTGARALQWATEERAGTQAASLTGREAEAVVAARRAREARARLAETGVAEEQLRTELAESQRRVDDASRQQAELEASIAALSDLTPRADRCLTEAIHLLNRLSNPSSRPTGLSTECRDLATTAP